ncbi:hypothetical protein [Adlercreutzia faecimuris]|uniref:DUF3592 domain-containing protein n=1 Tax=Adlercreutzia faecimuris TaxID=2897341 RepID=A0ABS9WIA7_9ACTN|nr:hypothetical protein [Adlercreutzia sp. JBNU-10]MCI2242618.1 hypothetical protein [Adlercreutzia sp. JBNU-10]
MLNTLIFVASVLVLFAGCAVLIVDVLISLSTDRCRVPVPAEYVAKPAGDPTEVNRASGPFVLAVPEFTYTFEGRRYRGKSANVFFHLYLRPGRLAVPFVAGKTYEVFVNPVKPTVFITAGEQRVTFLRLVGIAIVVVGLLLVYNAMHLPALS